MTDNREGQDARTRLLVDRSAECIIELLGRIERDLGPHRGVRRRIGYTRNDLAEARRAAIGIREALQ